jgi:hypothetical protein
MIQSQKMARNKMAKNKNKIHNQEKIKKISHKMEIAKMFIKMIRENVKDLLSGTQRPKNRNILKRKLQTPKKLKIQIKTSKQNNVCHRYIKMWKN